MNPVRIIPRTIVGTSLRLARLPLDVAATVTPVGGSSAKRALDRADATARAVAGALLRDPGMSQDAQRRYEALAARQRADELRHEAQRTAQEAEEQVETRHREAVRRRRSADGRAQARRQQAEERREQRVRKAGQAQRRRQQANREVESKVEQVIEEEAPRARLDALESELEAQREGERALASADEAHRLQEAAERAKEERKAG